MTRDQLEHIVRAAAYIVDDDELIIVGSQAVLGEFPDAPAALLRSDETDVYPKNKPELADASPRRPPVDRRGTRLQDISL